MILRTLMVLLAFGLASCTDVAPRGGGDILVLGDSLMAWNRGQDGSIADAIDAVLERDVVSKAVSGAQFDNGSGLAGAVGFDIRRQLQPGRWNWIVLNGGANDLSADCGCGACGPVVDRLIGADAMSGAIPAFVTHLRHATGAQVLWMGYYEGKGTGAFAGCRDDLVTMEDRIARFAALKPGVHFIDAEDVFNPRDLSHFAPDGIHPSPKASALIGAHLARRIARSQITDGAL